jgi:4-hydroxy-2-oxoheptanedioate aldolase
MTVDMVPMLIQTGARAIAVQFDVWGISRLFADSLKKGWDYAKEFEGNPRPGDVPNGQAKPE